MNVYVIDAGVDGAHPDLNVVDHVNFTWSANTATRADGAMNDLGRGHRSSVDPSHGGGDWHRPRPGAS